MTEKKKKKKNSQEAQGLTFLLAFNVEHVCVCTTHLAKFMTLAFLFKFLVLV